MEDVRTGRVARVSSNVRMKKMLIRSRSNAAVGEKNQILTFQHSFTPKLSRVGSDNFIIIFTASPFHHFIVYPLTTV